MSAVTILPFASQTETARAGGGFESIGASDAVDVSAHAVLRLVTRIDANLGSRPQCELYLETAPTDSGPWTIAWSRHMSTGAQPGADDFWSSAPRAVIGHVDTYARLRWAVRAGNEGLALSIGCDGEGVPDAA